LKGATGGPETALAQVSKPTQRAIDIYELLLRVKDKTSAAYLRLVSSLRGELRFDTALDADMLDKLEGAAAERRAARQAASVARALWRRISMTKLSTDQLAAVMVAARAART
jgi:hypothetical protein